MYEREVCPLLVRQTLFGTPEAGDLPQEEVDCEAHVILDQCPLALLRVLASAAVASLSPLLSPRARAA